MILLIIGDEIQPERVCQRTTRPLLHSSYAMLFVWNSSCTI